MKNSSVGPHVEMQARLRRVSAAQMDLSRLDVAASSGPVPGRELHPVSLRTLCDIITGGHTQVIPQSSICWASAWLVENDVHLPHNLSNSGKSI